MSVMMLARLRLAGVTGARCDGDRWINMPQYLVSVTRTERITFTINAADPADAEARYLSDGEETGAETVRTEVDSVEPAGNGS